MHGHSDTRVQPDALDGDAVPAEYFAARPTAVCDLCDLDTARSYPWTTRVLDIHHLLPLCSGMRVDNANTTFDDLVPICPTCHRAVHRFYDIFLRQQTRNDFTGVVEARATYDAVKQAYPGPQYAA